MDSIIKKIKTYPIFNFFTLFIRFLIGGAFLFASLPKIFGERFTNIPPDDPIGNFFECLFQTGLYWNFLGWAQVVAGFLLITQRFATLGAVMFYPILINIFVITLSLNMRGTPIITFLMVLANTWLLMWDWNKLKYILGTPIQAVQTVEVKEEGDSRHLWLFGILGVLFFLTSLIFLVWLKKPLIWLSLCFAEGLIALVLSLYWQRKNRIIRV